MSAATIMVIAFGLLILGHWANNEPTVTTKSLLQIVFAIFFIAFLDGIPSAHPLAMGLAWLFFAAVILSSGSILTGLSKSESASTSTSTTTKGSVTT